MNCFYIHNIKSLSLGTPNPLLGNNLGWARNLEIRTTETFVTVTMFSADPHCLLLPGEALDSPAALPAEPAPAPAPAEPAPAAAPTPEPPAAAPTPEPQAVDAPAEPVPAAAPQA